MKFALPVKVTTALARTQLKAQANAPQILFAGGVVLFGGTVIAACKATMGVEKTLDQHKQHIEWVKAQDGIDERKEVAVAYAITTKKLVRAYAPAVILGVGSIACFTQSHRILTSRNAALTASYAALDKAFDQYRARVRDRVGEDVEREIFMNVQEETVETTKKDGTVKKTKQKVKGGGSAYARLFHEDNKNWDTNPDYRVAFLRLKQNQFNDMLNARGHLFLNEVYDELGLDRCEAGQAVGWLRGDHPEAKDGYVDFGIFTDKSMEEFYNFIAGFEPIWLDFNVDGTIMDKI
jgi:hypothetical protein